jgi:hypothetical protein
MIENNYCRLSYYSADFHILLLIAWAQHPDTNKSRDLRRLSSYFKRKIEMSQLQDNSSIARSRDFPPEFRHDQSASKRLLFPRGTTESKPRISIGGLGTPPPGSIASGGRQVSHERQRGSETLIPPLLAERQKNTKESPRPVALETPPEPEDFGPPMTAVEQIMPELPQEVVPPQPPPGVTPLPPPSSEARGNVTQDKAESHHEQSREHSVKDTSIPQVGQIVLRQKTQDATRTPAKFARAASLKGMTPKIRRKVGILARFKIICLGFFLSCMKPTEQQHRFSWTTFARLKGWIRKVRESVQTKKKMQRFELLDDLQKVAAAKDKLADMYKTENKMYDRQSTTATTLGIYGRVTTIPYELAYRPI